MKKFLTFWLPTILINLLILEGISYVFVKSSQNYLDKTQYEARQRINAKTGVSDRILRTEVNKIFERVVEYHPYRGYKAPNNYSGTYIHLDDLGFRNGIETFNERSDKIGFFGSSTTFSVTTRDEGAFPHIINQSLNQNIAQAVNYGVGALGTTGDLLVFLEVSRMKKMKYAVFYDGASEVGRFVEKVQDRATSATYNYMAYPYLQALKPAMENFLRGRAPYELPYDSYLLQAIKKTYQRFIVPKILARFGVAPKLVEANEIEQFSEIVASIYENNVMDLDVLAKSKGIVPIFILQPNVYSSPRIKMSATEKANFNDEIYYHFHETAYEKIREKMKRHAKINFFDLSKSMSDYPEEDAFMDAFHLSEDANAFMSKKISVVLKKFVPGNYWKTN